MVLLFIAKISLEDILKSYNETSSTLLATSNIMREIEELKVWSESNKRTLETISFDHKNSFYEKLEPIVILKTSTFMTTDKGIQKSLNE